MKSRGFTLVELLVALFVMAVMAAMAWQGVDAMARTRTAGQARMEQALRLDTVMTQWEQDFAALHDVDGEVSFGFDGAVMHLTRRAHDANGVRLVIWKLRNGELQRWVGPAVTQMAALQEQWMRSLQFVGTEPGHMTVLKGVASIQLHCYRNNAWSNCQSSADVDTGKGPPGQPPSTPGGPPQPPAPRKLLPTGVRLVLSFTGDPLQGSLTRDVMLPAQQVTVP